MSGKSLSMLKANELKSLFNFQHGMLMNLRVIGKDRRNSEYKVIDDYWKKIRDELEIRGIGLNQCEVKR